ncbi:MAG: polysaccharide biosynthesis tyrosine autokinase, partial [Candidatus Binatia bacterium]
IAAEANFGEARRLLNSPDSLGTTAVQVLQSDLIRRFREQELELDRKAADMAEQYGARHPAMIQVQAQRQELRSKLRDEIQRITKSLENQVRITHTREASLARDLEVLKSKEAQSNQASLGLRVLERNAEANRLILQKMMASSIEAAAQNDMASQVPNGRVVSSASVPERPSFPRPLPLLLVTLLVGTALGVALAFALEQWQIGLRSAEQTELATGLPVLAHVPSVSALKSGRERISEYLRKRPASAFAEAIRALYMRLSLIRRHSAPGVVLVVSAQAEEGKTTICTSLARQHAQQGRRALVLDADFRRSSLAKSVGLESSPGLSELLVGTVELRDVLQQDPRSAAHFIVAGQHWVDSGLLVSSRLKEIVGQLSRSYDLIVIDSAPISAISDALVIAHIADTIIMAVRWGRTPQGVVCSVLNQIMAAGRQVDGIVLSMVRVSELKTYEYGDYGKSAKYYTTSSEQLGAEAG